MPVGLRLGLGLACLWLGALAAPAAAAPPPGAVPFDEIAAALSGVHQFAQVALSPDGRRFAYTEVFHDHSAIRLALVAKPRESVPVTACPGRSCEESDFAWSPDGSRLVFVTTDAKGQGQLAVVGEGGGRATVLTRAAGPLGTPRWSPDGTKLAFLYSPGAPKPPSPLNPATPDAGVVGATVYEQRVAVIPAEGGPARLLGPRDLNVYEYAWSPDGTHVAATAAHGNGDANWWVAELYLLDAKGTAARAIHKPELQIASPRWSGDGKQIAYIGGLMSDEAVTGGDVYVVPAAGGAATDVTPDLKASVTTIAWDSAGQILATELAGGRSTIARIDPPTRTQKQLWSGEEMIYASGFAGLAPGDEGLSVSRDGRLSATIRQSPTAPPEIALGQIGALHDVTDANAGLRRLTGRARSLTWKSDAYTVQGWLIFPPAVEAGKTYPVVTVVHGGPAYAHYPMFPSGAGTFAAVLAARGNIVFEPNPRGSYGEGEAFTRANVKDFGYGDLRDILTGLDAVGKTVHVDPNRVGIFGWSYGGYMTMWAITQTDRFRAAVAGAGVCDWLSYYGTNDIDTWMIPYFGASVYDDPAVYARSAPIGFVKKVRTPTLMVAGDRDAEVPVTQSYEFYHALKELGVPAELVIYPGEGHEFGKPADQRDVDQRIAGWFDQRLR